MAHLRGGPPLAAPARYPPHLCKMKSTHFTEIDSPLGTISLCGTERGLVGIFMEDHRHGPTEAQRHSWQRADALFAEVGTQLLEYFSGRRTIFSVGFDREAM